MTDDQDPDRRRRAGLKSRIDGPNIEAADVRNCRVVPTRDDLLGLLPQGGVAAEIGVAEGAFSRKILDINEPGALHLVDAWEGERYGASLERVRTRLAPEIASGRVTIHQGRSTDVMPRAFEDGSLDWLYIDTDHSYDTTMAELRIAERKVRPDDLILSHDFCVGNVVHPYVYGVIQACCRFCRESGWEFWCLTLETYGHWSYALRRIRD